MAHSATNDDALIASINVTPLVDITLVLLIVFMVTARLIASQAIPFEIPKVVNTGHVQTTFTVNVDAEGHTAVDGARVDDATLSRLAKRALTSDRELRTVIQASSSASHGQVVHVLDELRGAGVTRVAFAAIKVSKP